jgi:AraC-like DNA-binding protein
MRLNPGEYLGETLWERAIPGLRLTLSAYQPCCAQPWHRHTYPTFFLLLAGDHSDHTRQNVHRQSEFTFVFHPATTEHAGELGPGPTRGLNIEYQTSWLERHQLAERDLHEYRTLQSAHVRLIALRLLATAFQPGGKRVDADLETQAFELLVPLISRTATEARMPGWFSKAEDFMQASFRDPISLRDVADEVGVHPVYLARVFRRVRRCTVSEYLRMLRLTEAGRLVLQGASLAQAAYAAGFADQAHFSRCCSATLGFSPKGFFPARQSLSPRDSHL